jgi:hypothetical protein
MLYINGKPLAAGPATKLAGPTPVVIGNVGEEQYMLYFRGELRCIRISKGERYSGEFVPEETFTSDDDTVLLYDTSSFAGSAYSTRATTAITASSNASTSKPSTTKR